MSFISVVDWAPADQRVVKYQDFATEAEAEAHTASVLSAFPNAFSAANPGGGPADWLVDPAAKTLSLSPLDRSADRKREAKFQANNQATLIMAELFVDLIEALLAKGVIVVTDFPLATRQKYQDLKTLVDAWRAL